MDRPRDPGAAAPRPARPSRPRHAPSATVALAVLLLMAWVAPALAQPQAVRTATAAELAQPARHSAPAEVVAPHRSVLAAETTATVREVLADVGARVEKDAVLVQLDDTDARLALRQAQARAESARAEVELARQRLARGRDLDGRGFISKDELLALDTSTAAAAANLDIAQAAVAIAERTLAKTTVRAPFAASVAERQAQQGALAAPGTPLLTVVSMEAPELSATVAAADAESLRSAATLHFDSGDARHPVRLLRLVDAIDRRARTREARLAFDGPAPLPGRTGTLHWDIAGAELPASLLVRRDGRLGVFELAGGQARFVPVPDAEEGRPFRSPLPADARIVVEGQAALQDGQPATAQ